jgi:hypothetical protein
MPERQEELLTAPRLRNARPQAFSDDVNIVTADRSAEDRVVSVSHRAGDRLGFRLQSDSQPGRLARCVGRARVGVDLSVGTLAEIHSHA